MIVACMLAALLAGCTDGGSTVLTSTAPKSSSRPTGAKTGTLVVHLGLYGGPGGSDGRQAFTDAPRVGQTVNLTRSNTHVTLRDFTDSSGNAVFHVPAGVYLASSTGCGGPPPTRVNVRAATRSRVEIVCAVP
ncbi:hypothetical protein GCM10027265_34610 [Jatrophihabitans fulvus]